MPKQFRLSRADFAQFRPTERVSSDYFSAQLSANLDRAAGACVVSKKVAPLASHRNKIRRTVRPQLTAFLKGIETPLAIVIVAKKDAGSASTRSLREDIAALLKRIMAKSGRAR